jgi:hypothetical protein
MPPRIALVALAIAFGIAAVAATVTAVRQLDLQTRMAFRRGLIQCRCKD